MATLVAGPRPSNSVRPIYALASAGIAVTRWGGGAYIPGGSNPNVVIQNGAGGGPTLAVYQAGIGSEFHALGANRIELRVDIMKPGAPAFGSSRRDNNSGHAISLALGRVW
jgi:hypothetical protein